MNANRKLLELEAQLLEKEIVVTLQLTADGIEVDGKLPDRILARAYLRELGMIIV